MLQYWQQNGGGLAAAGVSQPNQVSAFQNRLNSFILNWSRGCVTAGFDIELQSLFQRKVLKLVLGYEISLLRLNYGFINEFFGIDISTLVPWEANGPAVIKRPRAADILFSRSTGVVTHEYFNSLFLK